MIPRASGTSCRGRRPAGRADHAGDLARGGVPGAHARRGADGMTGAGARRADQGADDAHRARLRRRGRAARAGGEADHDPRRRPRPPRRRSATPSTWAARCRSRCCSASSADRRVPPPHARAGRADLAPIAASKLARLIVYVFAAAVMGVAMVVVALAIGLPLLASRPDWTSTRRTTRRGRRRGPYGRCCARRSASASACWFATRSPAWWGRWCGC